MQTVLGSEWGRLFRNWESLRPDELGYPDVGEQPAELTRTGWAAFGQSIKILGTCVKEAPEFSLRKRKIIGTR